MNKEDLKMGDTIEVMLPSGLWVERVFIKLGKESKVICVHNSTEVGYYDGSTFIVDSMPKGKWRIPKEPEYIPFTYDDYEQLIGKAIKTKSTSKDNKGVYLINRVYFSTDITHPIQIGTNWNISFEYLFKNCEFLDGTPCGKLKE